MDEAERMRPGRGADLIALILFLLACFLVSGIGGLVTASSVGGWYTTLVKPPFNPPDWVFGPVWTVLYVMIAVSGWMVWRTAGWARGRTALILWGVQLALNLTWSVLFFGLQAVGAAFAEILVLFAAIFATILQFRPLNRLAAWLMVPYLLWVGFAVLLNASIWLLN